MKICPKKSGDEDGHLKCARGVSLDRSDWEGESPLPGTEEVHLVTPSDSKFTVKGTFCEVPVNESGLASIIKNDGMTMHSLSGMVNDQSKEPFDQVKIAVKRGEIDLHIVPTDHCSQQRLIAGCRVATRRHIWRSMECSIVSTFWDVIKKLLEIEDVHHIDATVSRVLTKIPCWKCVDDSAQLPGKFREFLNKIAMDLAYMCVKHQMRFICVSGVGPSQTPHAFICVSPNASAEFVTEFTSLTCLCSLRSHVF